MQHIQNRYLVQTTKWFHVRPLLLAVHTEKKEFSTYSKFLKFQRDLTYRLSPEEIMRIFQKPKAWEVNSNLAIISREGNGTPLQYSCLENPMDGGAWWAAVHGVAKSQT